MAVQINTGLVSMKLQAHINNSDYFFHIPNNIISNDQICNVIYSFNSNYVTIIVINHIKYRSHSDS